jgi:hypothetical protein
MGGQHLGRVPPAGGLEHHIGEGAADIDTEGVIVRHGRTVARRAEKGKGRRGARRAATSGRGRPRRRPARRDGVGLRRVMANRAPIPLPAVS